MRVIPIAVTELVPDPDGEEVADMLGIAHEVRKPPSWLLQFPWGKDYASKSAADRTQDSDWKPEFADKEDMAHVSKLLNFFLLY